MPTEPAPRGLAGRLTGVVVICAAAILGAAIDGRGPWGPTALERVPRLGAPVEAPCGRWRILVGSGQAAGAELRLFTDGLAIFDPCGPGPVDVTLRGTPALGVDAYVVLEDERAVRFAGSVSEAVQLQASGRLRLAFTNDLATTHEDRNAFAQVR